MPDDFAPAKFEHNVLGLIQLQRLLARQAKILSANDATCRSMAYRDHVSFQFLQPGCNPPSDVRHGLAAFHGKVPMITASSFPCAGFPCFDGLPVKPLPTTKSDFLNPFVKFNLAGIEPDLSADQLSGMERSTERTRDNSPCLTSVNQ